MFNLKKAQQNTGDTALASPEMGSGGQFPPSTDQMGNTNGFEQPQEQAVPDFQSSDELRDWLDGLAQEHGEHASDEAIQQLQSLPGLNTKDLQTDPNTNEQIDPLEMIKGGVARFFDPEMQNNPEAKEKKLQIAEKIFSVISGKDDSSEESVATIQQNVPVNIANTVTQSNLELKKAAQDSVNRVTSKRSNSKSFNLSKTAQHKGLENTIMFGPEGNHIDAFTGQMINDWHLIERNKGWGFKVDDKLNIDWESYWRSNIMDKFYSPYKDKEGNWVGGYLEGRFETDRNIPPYNNYQLKPGEKRRPYLPQYSLTEARLEDARDQMNKDRDYSPADKGKVFNWKEASANLSKKKVVTAFLPPITDKAPPHTKTDVWGDKIHSAEPSHLCPKCGEVANNPCENCGMKTQDSIKQFAPDKPGKQTQDQFAVHNTAIPVGSARAAVPIQASAKMNDIFFDGNSFVVYANSQKFKFADYYKAKEFKVTDTNQPQVSEPKQPMVPPFKRNLPNGKVEDSVDTLTDEHILADAHKLEDEELLERANAARSLGIDG